MTVKAAMKKFKTAVNTTPNLNSTWQPGLEALRAVDRPHIKAADTRMLLGSVDIDKAHLKIKKHADANRWDFAIGYKHSNRQEAVIYWVEIHTGSDIEFKVMLKKFDWLMVWLRGDGRALGEFEREFVWVASDATKFTDTAKQKKIMAQKGLRYAGKCLPIPLQRPG